MFRKSSNKQNEDELEMVSQAIANDDYPIANGGLISILERNPLLAEANRLRSLLMAAAGDFPEALASAVVLTAVEPDVARHWVLRGKLEIELRFRSSAMRSLNRADELGPLDEEVRQLLQKADRL